MQNILDKLSNVNGNIGFYYKNLITGEVVTYNQDKSLLAASLIKLLVLGAVFEQIEDGKISKDEVFTTRDEDKVPSCGALNYMREDLKVTLEDLYVLMIILSDNYASNILIDRCSIEKINDFIKRQGFKNTVLNRKLFDADAQADGLENYTSAEDMGILLERIYNSTFVSKEASQEMLEILKNQRLNSKIPFYLSSRENKTVIAHKTGEDTDTTHDVAIVFAKEPFIVCFLGNDVYVPEYERIMQDITFEIYKKVNL